MSSVLNDAILNYLSSTSQHTAHSTLSKLLNVRPTSPRNTANVGSSGGQQRTEGLVGNGTEVDGIGDVVLWGVGRGGLEQGLNIFWNKIRSITIQQQHLPNTSPHFDLNLLLTLVYIHVFLDLVALKDTEAAVRVRDKYFKLVKQWYPFVSELQTIDCTATFKTSNLDHLLSNITKLREEVDKAKREHDEHLSRYKQLLASEVPGGEYGNKLKAKIHKQKLEVNKLVTSLEGELSQLKGLSITAGLRSQRGVVGMTPSSYALLQEVVRDHRVAPITAIIYSRCIIEVGGKSRAEFKTEDMELNTPNPLMKIGGEYGHPDWSNKFSEALLNSTRKISAVIRDNEIISYPSSEKSRILKGIKTYPGEAAYTQMDGPFKPSICIGTVATKVVRVNRKGEVETEGRDISTIKVSPSTIYMAAGGEGVRVWNVGDKSEEGRPFVGHSGNVYSISWHPASRHFLSGGSDRTVHLWDSTLPSISNVNNSVAPIASYYDDGSVYGVAYGTGGYYWASCGEMGGRLWVEDRTSPVRIFTGHTGAVNSISFHPNSSYVATSGDDCTVRIWDIHSSNCVRILTGFYGGVGEFTWSPDGRTLAAADAKGIVSVFDIGEGKKIMELKPTNPSYLYSLKYSPCSSALSTGSSNSILIYDVRGNSGKEIKTFDTRVEIMDMV
eukprot:CAMPEP_0118640714 /NCGR_PEP_ID=MMETSP0785-20121206/4899_1 /TAXON_ID=91992 /ORGANISM="Bolidomonas pacifica, Strain CCMP 1866" /LENGTH=666 /DNA_ID=CAMNT_0006532117 /DNA_START=122 /DNA_END=2118 /DNA_ORIENTATION=+